MAKGTNVEEAIEAELTLAEAGNPQRYRGLMALRYFLRQLIDENTTRRGNAAEWVTNYFLLLEVIEVWRRQADDSVPIVTFNYDSMLEVAIRHALGFELFSIDAYVNRNDYKLFKLPWKCGLAACYPPS